MEDTQTLNNEDPILNERIKIQDESEIAEKMRLRREARMRKILENSKTRLEKLNGRTSDNAELQRNNALKAERLRDYPDPEVEPEIYRDMPERMMPQDSNVNLTDMFASIMHTPTEQRHFLLQYRLHLILVAVISYVTAFIVHEKGIAFSLFIPVGICIAMELIYFKKQQPLNPLTALYLSTLITTISKIRTDKVNIFLQLLFTIHSVVTDLCLVIFFYGILTFMLVSVDDRFANLMTIK